MKLTLFSIIFFLVVSAAVVAADSTPSCSLSVGFDLEANRLKGTAEISFPASLKGWSIHTEGIKVLSVRASNGEGSFTWEADLIEVLPTNDGNNLTITYTASYPAPVMRGRQDGIETANIINTEGIALLDSWYPSVEGGAEIRLTAVLPDGFEGISEADFIEVRQLTGNQREFKFLSDNPFVNINFIAARYAVLKDRVGAVNVMAYFFPDDSDIAKTYLEQTKGYISMYESMIGPFPFRRFSVVENLLPTGYSMPTYTLLGRDVVRLPFISETSLGHEVLHQWFGNSVYADYSGGNWSEGLTTYLSDHLYEDRKGKGSEYRKNAMLTYLSYVNEKNDIPLKEFSSRTDKATASVGYGKAAMVFHMLRKEIGDEVFMKALQDFYLSNRFKTASWTDIRNAFENASGQRLDSFFDEWINAKGMIDFDIENTMLIYEGSKARISFDVTQKKDRHRFKLPVIVRTDKGENRKIFSIDGEKTTVTIEISDIPLDVVIDAEYDLFRTLYDEETAPVLSMLLGDSNRTIVFPEGKEKDYTEVSAMLKDEGFHVKSDAELEYDDMKKSSLLIISGTDLADRLFARTWMPDGDFAIVMKRNPYNKNKVIGIMKNAPADEYKRHLWKITHYGKYNMLSFADGRNILKLEGDSGRGIRLELKNDPVGVELHRTVSMSEVIEKVSKKDIVYVGERHDRPEHHRVQFEIIRELYNRNKKLAIGMEMFQRPYQDALDAYVKQKIDEKSFLKKSEYFNRWGFDYNLYREILLFARENRIPVIALNIKKEIVDKVAKEGLLALKDDELGHIPPELDLSDSLYRERLKTFFTSHSGSGSMNFDFFFQSQVLWDESMAKNLDDFIKQNPDYQVVVLAGGGHMMFGSGIPSRAHRMNKRSYAVILNGDEIEKDIADFVLYPQPVVFPESPKLGVMLKDDVGQLLVSGFSKDSVAENAGIRVDDIIISVEGEKVEKIEDLKLILLYKKKGDEITLRVRRKRFLLGDKEMEIKVTL